MLGDIARRQCSHSRRTAIAVSLVALATLLAGCATRAYRGNAITGASFLERALTRQAGDLMVIAAVPDADETLALTGLDLYEQGIQPVWLQVENHGGSVARVAGSKLPQRRRCRQGTQPAFPRPPSRRDFLPAAR